MEKIDGISIERPLKEEEANSQIYFFVIKNKELAFDGRIFHNSHICIIEKQVDNGCYLGEATGSIINGYGMLKTNEFTYEGMFFNDMPHGIGKKKNADGATMEGKFRKGVFYGKGRIILDNGKRMEGKFINEKPDGMITIYNNNKITEALYKDGCLIKDSSIDSNNCSLFNEEKIESLINYFDKMNKKLIDSVEKMEENLINIHETMINNLKTIDERQKRINPQFINSPDRISSIFSENNAPIKKNRSNFLRVFKNNIKYIKRPGPFTLEIFPYIECNS